MLARDLGHANAHLATGDKVVAEKHEEGITVDLVGRLEDGVTEAAGNVLIDEGDGKRGGGVDAIGLRGLPALAKGFSWELTMTTPSTPSGSSASSTTY